MRIDLYSSKGVSLTLFGELQTPNDLASAWRDAGFTYKEGQHITALRSVGGYRRAGCAHRVSLDISTHKRSDGTVDNWDFSLRYSCPILLGRPLRNPPRNVTSRTKQLESFLSLSEVTNISTEVHCHVDYVFQPSTVDSIVVIPLMQFNDSSLPFTEIGGVRLVKSTNNHTEYEVFLDEGDNGELHVGISFHSNIKLNIREPGRMLLKSNQILSKFIAARNNQ